MSVEPLLPGWRQTAVAPKRVMSPHRPNREETSYSALGGDPKQISSAGTRSGLSTTESMQENSLYNLEPRQESISQPLDGLNFLKDPNNRAFAAELLQQMEAEEAQSDNEHHNNTEQAMESRVNARSFPHHSSQSLSSPRHGGDLTREQQKRLYAADLLQQMEAEKERKAVERRNELEQELRAQNVLDFESEKRSAKPHESFGAPEKRVGIYNYVPESKHTESLSEPRTPRPQAESSAHGTGTQRLPQLSTEETARDRQKREYAEELRAQIESNNKRKQRERQRDMEEAKHSVSVFAAQKPRVSAVGHSTSGGVRSSNALSTNPHQANATTNPHQALEDYKSYFRSENRVPTHPRSAYQRSDNDSAMHQSNSHRSVSAKPPVSHQPGSTPLLAADVERDRRKRAYAEELKAQMELAKRKKEEARRKEVEEERKCEFHMMPCIRRGEVLVFVSCIIQFGLRDAIFWRELLRLQLRCAPLSQCVC